MTDVTVFISVPDHMEESEIFSMLDELEELINFSESDYVSSEWMDSDGVHYHSAG